MSKSMPYDEMLSWLLFHTGILDLQRLPHITRCRLQWQLRSPEGTSEINSDLASGFARRSGRCAPRNLAHP